jgi:hypothetical protein
MRVAYWLEMSTRIWLRLVLGSTTQLDKSLWMDYALENQSLETDAAEQWA